jgi:hypothetical protein
MRRLSFTFSLCMYMTESLLPHADPFLVSTKKKCSERGSAMKYEQNEMKIA